MGNTDHDLSVLIKHHVKDASEAAEEGCDEVLDASLDDIEELAKELDEEVALDRTDTWTGPEDEVTRRAWSDDDSKSPDAIWRWSRSQPDAEGCTFLYYPGGKLYLDKPCQPHSKILADFDLAETCREIQNQVVSGRVGSTGSDDYFIAVWDSAMISHLPECLEKLIARGIIKPETELHLRQGVTTVANVLNGDIDLTHAGGQTKTKSNDSSTQNWELLRQIHTMQGDEKKAARKKLGLYNPSTAEHPWQKAMREKGLIGPGQKWWAQQSESRRFSKALAETLTTPPDRLAQRAAVRQVCDQDELNDERDEALSKIEDELLDDGPSGPDDWDGYEDWETDELCTPDSIYSWAGDTDNDDDGRTFIYTDDQGLEVGNVRTWYTDMARNIGLQWKTRGSLEKQAILGRVGTTRNSRYDDIVAIWNDNPAALVMLPACLKALIDTGLADESTPLHMRDGITTVGDAVSDGQIHQPEQEAATKDTEKNAKSKTDWDLLRRMHLLRGDEKREAMRQLGLYNPERAEHPWQRSMREKGLIGPGQKWWAMQSESRRFTLALNEALDSGDISPHAITRMDNDEDEVPEVRLRQPEQAEQVGPDLKNDSSRYSTSLSNPSPLYLGDSSDLGNDWRYSSAASVSPDDIWNDLNGGDGEITGATFIYFYKNGELATSHPGNTHYDLATDLGHYFASRTDMAAAGLLGRAGYCDGRYQVSFWNSDPGQLAALPDCLRKLLEKGLVKDHTWVNTYKGTSSVEDILGGAIWPPNTEQQSSSETGEANADATRREKWELLQQMHLMRGNEKKEAMKKLGLYNPKQAEHPWATALKKAGLLGPGQKWQSPQSESRRFSSALSEALASL